MTVLLKRSRPPTSEMTLASGACSGGANIMVSSALHRTRTASTAHSSVLLHADEMSAHSV